MGGPESWLWNFGDFGSSTLRNPVHTYLIPGNYTVSLQVTTDQVTATETKEQYITVIGPTPVVSGINPAFGYQNGLLVNATITGSGFWDGATVTLKGTPEISGADLRVASNTTIICRFNLTNVIPATRDVQVTNRDGKTGIGEDLFTIRHRGDFNGNGNVDIGDVAKVAWMAVGFIPDDPEARFTGGGHVTGADAARNAYFYVGKTQEI